MAKHQKEIDNVINATASGDEGAIGDALATLAEHVPVDRALSGEMLAGIAMFNITYDCDPDKVAAVLRRYSPDHITNAAWNLEGRGYEPPPETGSEYAERVALVLAMLYSDSQDEKLDVDLIIGKGRDLLPDLPFESEEAGK